MEFKEMRVAKMTISYDEFNTLDNAGIIIRNLIHYMEENEYDEIDGTDTNGCFTVYDKWHLEKIAETLDNISNGQDDWELC